MGHPLSVVSQILFESTAVKTTVQDQTRKSRLGEIEGSEAELNDAPPVLRSLSVFKPLPHCWAADKHCDLKFLHNFDFLQM